MIVSTCETVPGHEIEEVLGLVRGNTIRARHLGRDITAGIKGLLGGEIQDYTKLMAESREQAIDRMTAHANELGADLASAFSDPGAQAMSAQLDADIKHWGEIVATEFKHQECAK